METPFGGCHISRVAHTGSCGGAAHKSAGLINRLQLRLIYELCLRTLEVVVQMMLSETVTNPSLLHPDCRSSTLIVSPPHPPFTGVEFMLIRKKRHKEDKRGTPEEHRSYIHYVSYISSYSSYVSPPGEHLFLDFLAPPLLLVSPPPTLLQAEVCSSCRVDVSPSATRRLNNGCVSDGCAGPDAGAARREPSVFRARCWDDITH